MKIQNKLLRYQQAEFSYMMQARRRVVVTGIGIVSCLGVEVTEVFSRLISGKIGISKLSGHGKN